MILVIDNYDSFVYNLARHIELAGLETRVVRNDAANVAEIADMGVDGIVLSPGPCTPDEAGICVELIRELGDRVPILGVCLGHQAIGEAYGAKTVRAARPVHGKCCEITHDGTGLFEGLPSPMRVGRYHSLITEMDGAQDLVMTARSEDGEIMAMRHREHPVYGVQFHPESVLTEHGLQIVQNFVVLAAAFHEKQRRAA